MTPNQSGFRPGDSCVNQLIPITHEMYKSFDDGLEVRGVFLDISKTDCNLTVNRLILNATIEYLISTERFKYPLLNQ